MRSSRFLCQKSKKQNNNVADRGGDEQNYERSADMERYMATHKLARVLSTQELNVQDDSFSLNDGRRAEVNVFLRAEDGLDAEAQLDYMDGILVATVFSFLQAGRKMFRIDDLVRAMTGNPAQKMTPKWLENMRGRIEKLRAISITIQVKPRAAGGGDEPELYEGPLLPVERVSAAGREIYQIVDVPVVFQYAGRSKQIASFPEELLQTEKYYNDSEMAVCIKYYVIWRVIGIRSDNRLSSDKIAFEWRAGGQEGGLYVELGFDTIISTVTPEKWRTKIKPRIVKIVSGTLQHMVDVGYIGGFKPYRAEGSHSRRAPVMGYTIDAKKAGRENEKSGTRTRKTGDTGGR
jgi:hypothetical protein